MAGNNSFKATSAAATLAPSGRSSTVSATPARSFTMAKNLTRIRMAVRILVRLITDDRNLVAICQFQHLLFFKQDGFSRFEYDAARLCGREFFDRRHADRRDVHAHVLVFVGDLDQ